MSDNRPTILLVEDTRTVQSYIRDVVRSLTIEHHFHVARRVDEAKQLANEHQISLFIVDIGLPDGDGIDFLCEMATLHPRARALIITSTPREDYRDRARQIGVLTFLPKPLQRQPLLDAVTDLLRPATGNASTEPNGFEGTLGGLSPADIIQLKCLSRATGLIEFTTDERYGMVWLENGDLWHAETEDVNGKLSGEKAFLLIVSWRSGTVREVPMGAGVQRSIQRSWQSLLMDAASPESSVTA